MDVIKKKCTQIYLSLLRLEKNSKKKLYCAEINRAIYVQECRNRIRFVNGHSLNPYGKFDAIEVFFDEQFHSIKPDIPAIFMSSTTATELWFFDKGKTRSFSKGCACIKYGHYSNLPPTITYEMPEGHVEMLSNHHGIITTNPEKMYHHVLTSTLGKFNIQFDRIQIFRQPSKNHFIFCGKGNSETALCASVIFDGKMQFRNTAFSYHSQFDLSYLSHDPFHEILKSRYFPFFSIYEKENLKIEKMHKKMVNLQKEIETMACIFD